MQISPSAPIMNKVKFSKYRKEHYRRKKFQYICTYWSCETSSYPFAMCFLHRLLHAARLTKYRNLAKKK